MNQATAQNNYRLKPLLAGVADVKDNEDCVIRGLALDSRDVVDDGLFFAVPGIQVDGRCFVGDAVKRGASAVAYEAESAEKGVTLDVSVPAYPIAGLRQQIGAIASRFFASPSMQLRMIGITGTNGKTTCCHLAAQALQHLGVNTAVIGTIGSGFIGGDLSATLTTPDAISLQRLLAEFCAQKGAAVCMEVSSHGLDQGRVNGVEFDLAIFTNLSHDHLDYHGDMQAYAKAKARLFEFPGLQHAIINIDDDFGRNLASRTRDADVLTYSQIATNEADVYACYVEMTARGLYLDVATPIGRIRFTSRLIGRFNVSNLLAVIAMLVAMEKSASEISAAMTALQSVPGRMEVFHGREDQPRVVVDYAHTPDALEHVLTDLAEHTTGSLWCVFGCGGDRDQAKRPRMGAIAERLADHVILTNDNPRGEAPQAIVDAIQSGMSTMPTIILDRREAIGWCVDQADAGDTVLIAGKGHEPTQTIGNTVLPLDDRHIVRELMESMA